MFRRITLAAAVLAGMQSFAAAQEGQQPAGESEGERQARANREKLLGKLDLLISTVADDRETPRAQYRVGEEVVVRVGATNRDEKVAVVMLRRGYEHFFLTLLKDGLPVRYSRAARERLLSYTGEPFRSSWMAVRVEAGAEGALAVPGLSHWYDRLEPGVYQLTMRFALVRTDPKVKTNTVVFEVVRE